MLHLPGRLAFIIGRLPVGGGAAPALNPPPMAAAPLAIAARPPPNAGTPRPGGAEKACASCGDGAPPPNAKGPPARGPGSWLGAGAPKANAAAGPGDMDAPIGWTAAL